VANQPRLMRELLSLSLADEQDVEIVARVSDEAEIARMIDETSPEFLIVALDSRRFGASAREAALQRHPGMKILALAGDGNSFTVFSASDGIRSMIHEGSEAEILKVIWGSAHMGGNL
jgi:DNA-binding NarL/FixJ family response regulator